MTNMMNATATTTATAKTTRISALQYVLDNCEIPAEIAEKLESMKKAIMDSKVTIRKPTEQQTKNAQNKVAIYNMMVELATPMTCTQIAEECIARGIMSREEASVARVSALLTQLGEGTKTVKGDHLITRTAVGKSKYFTVNAPADGEAEEATEEIAE